MVSTSSSQAYLRLWVCMGDVQQDGLLLVLSDRSVSMTASSHRDTHPQIPVRREGSPALNLVRNPQSLQRAGGHVEKRLVLVHLFPGSGTDACVSGVHADCIAAGVPHCHVFNPHEAPPKFLRMMMRL